MTLPSPVVACRLAAIVAVVCGLAGPTAAAEPAIPPFQVVVSPSPKAAARLASLGESITVAAMFHGELARAARSLADSTGQINLGREEVVMPGERGVASMTGNGIDPAKAALVRGRVQVLINVYSARKVDADPGL